MSALRIELPDDAATARLGEAFGRLLRPGDALLLSGDLGAGKSTLARAALRTLAEAPELEVPSPTFALVQPYGGGGFRFPVLHADLYRLEGAAEADDLGLAAALADGAVIVEWPERAPGAFPVSAMEVTLEDVGEGRIATLSSGSAATLARLGRLLALRRFLDDTAFAGARRGFLQGDASPRAYERLIRADGATAVLLDADHHPDRRPTDARRAYMAATHLVPNEDVRPVLAINATFAAQGFAVPAVHAADPALGVILMQDLGSGRIVDDGRPIPERYAVAVEVLAAMHARLWPEVAAGPMGISHPVPLYDARALHTEAGVMIETALPLVAGAPVPASVAAAYDLALGPIVRLLTAVPSTWTAMDYHSPNIVWREGEAGLGRIGLLDLQDTRRGAPAYDVASLCLDARVTIEPALEAELLARYRAAVTDPAFDPALFEASYAAAGAQRNARILGVFARLALQDMKPAYLKHVPRIVGYLERAFRHPVTRDLAAWFRAHVPDRMIADLVTRGAP